MRKSLAVLGVAAAAVFLATSASAANRGVTFTGVGFISGPTCVGGTNPGAPCTTNANCPGTGGRCQQPASSVWDMNADGTVYLVSPASTGTFAAIWTPEGGWGDLIGSVSGTYIVSPSGDTVMGNGVFPGSNPAFAWPGTWTGTQDVWDPLPADASYAPCGSSRLSLLDMSGEGDYSTGLTWFGACRAQGMLWDKATNTTLGLGEFNNRSTRGNAVPTDGSKVIGWGTMAQGLRRGAVWQNGAWTFLGDPGNHEPKVCAQSGNACTFNGAGNNGCTEYVNDGLCANRGTCNDKGTCVSNVCVGGPDGGSSCTNSNQCRGVCGGGSNDGTLCTSNNSCAGTCTGPNAGASCTSEGTCPDTLVCINNPEWTADMFKGEAYDVSDDGQYAIGRQFDYDAASGLTTPAGYRTNPDGTFTRLDVIPDFPDRIVDPFDISANGKVIGGRVGSFLTGTSAYLWIEGVGPVDPQTFLVAQGLDELFFWFLSQVNAISADGTKIGGIGFNPDGRQEGFVIDISKLWVCHAPGGDAATARTLGVGLDGLADHVAHGDFLGTCEFQASGALSRAVEARDALGLKYKDRLVPQSLENEASSAWDLVPATQINKVKKVKEEKARGRAKNSTRD